MTQPTGDLSLEWKTIRQQTLSSIYSVNLTFKLDPNVKLTKKKKKQIECLTNNQYYVAQLVELNNKLNYQISWLFDKARQHDHTGQQANGYYSMIRILFALFKLISKKVPKLSGTRTLKTEMIDLLNVTYYVAHLIDNMILIFDYKNNGHRPLDNDAQNLFSLSIEHFKTMNLLALDEDAQRALSVICGPAGVFWYSKSMQNVFKAFRLLLIGCTSNPFKFLHCLVNSKACGRNLARKCANSTVEYVTHSLNALEFKAYNRTYFTLINLSNTLRYTANTVHVKVSTSRKVPLNDPNNNDESSNEHIQFVDAANQRKVRCRLISGYTKSFIKKFCKENKLSLNEIDPRANINPTKCVVFHVHGGGFSVTTPDTHEVILFLSLY